MNGSVDDGKPDGKKYFELLPLLPLVLSALPPRCQERELERPRDFGNDSVHHGQQPHRGSVESHLHNSIDCQIGIEIWTSHSQSNGFVKERTRAELIG